MWYQIFFVRRYSKSKMLENVLLSSRWKSSRRRERERFTTSKMNINKNFHKCILWLLRDNLFCECFYLYINENFQLFFYTSYKFPFPAPLKMGFFFEIWMGILFFFWNYCHYEWVNSLPTTLGELLVFRQIFQVDTNHSLTEVLRDLSQNLSIVEVSDSLDNGLSTLGWVTRLEDTRTNKDTITTQLLFTKKKKKESVNR